MYVTDSEDTPANTNEGVNVIREPEIARQEPG